MTNCIIIHGCPIRKEKAMDPSKRTYDKHWMPWTKQKLISLGIPTQTPLMPNPWDPVYEDFKNEFEKYKIDQETILVGHSCGGTFLVRWLGETKTKIYKLIIVAPWKKVDGDDQPKDFYEYLINPTIKERAEKIIYFTSDNEREKGKEAVKMFHDVIGGKIIEIKGYGHYIVREMGTVEFPELIKEIVG